MTTLSRPRRFQITRVWARNFRSIADASLDLDQLTVLVGPNASGKSNLLDILRFVKDALRFDLEAAISMRHGFDAIRRIGPDSPSSEVDIGLRAIVSVAPSVADHFVIDYGFTLASNVEGGHRVTQEYAIVHLGEQSSVAPFVFRIEDGRLTSPGSSLPPDDTQPDQWQDDEEPLVYDTQELSLRRLMRPLVLGRFQSSAEEDGQFTIYSRPVDTMLRRIAAMRFYHIFPNTIREPQRLDNPYPLNEDAGNLASVLRDFERSPGNTIDRLKGSLGRLVPGVSDLELTSAGGYLVVRLKHENEHGGGWIDLSQESDGTVRLLGLLTALHQRRTLPLIGVEEPELTVHPGALTALADELKEKSRSSQLIVTTHSPDLIDRITDFRDVDSLRVVELIKGATEVNVVSGAQKEAVMRHLFSPGELHRQGELETFGALQ
ncbi:MAG: AAA family ATPase [Chloroflexi bacterium]|nr:AAA family ATPase [Chloroflexota bacterium]